MSKYYRYLFVPRFLHPRPLNAHARLCCFRLNQNFGEEGSGRELLLLAGCPFCDSWCFYMVFLLFTKDMFSFSFFVKYLTYISSKKKSLTYIYIYIETMVLW